MTLAKFGDLTVWAMIALYAVACVVYLIAGKWAKAMYFGGAVILTAGVLLMDT